MATQVGPFFGPPEEQVGPFFGPPDQQVGPFFGPPDMVESPPDLHRLPEPAAIDGLGPHGYQLRLQMSPHRAVLTIAGVLDEGAADAIGGMICPDGPVLVQVELHAGAVSVVESEAVRLLVAALRERHQHALPPVRLAVVSDALARALAAIDAHDVPRIVHSPRNDSRWGGFRS